MQGRMQNRRRNARLELKELAFNNRKSNTKDAGGYTRFCFFLLINLRDDAFLFRCVLLLSRGFVCWVVIAEIAQSNANWQVWLPGKKSSDIAVQKSPN